jgi:putative spermidine/putrescine transport system substrate-binding protein
MLSAHAKSPNCMYMWMTYTMSADVQAEVAAFYGATPSNMQSCPALAKAIGQEQTDDVYHCGDDEYLSSIYLWKTPLADCGGGAECTDYTEWTTKWTEVRGG